MLFRLIRKFKKSKSGAYKSAFFSLLIGIFGIFLFGFQAHASTYSYDSLSLPIVHAGVTYTHYIAWKSGSTANPDSFTMALCDGDFTWQFGQSFSNSLELSCFGHYVSYVSVFDDFYSATSGNPVTTTFATNVSPEYYQANHKFDSVTSPSPDSFSDGSYDLQVVSPRIGENNSADVQSSSNFKVLIHYKVPDDRYALTHFVLKQCDSFDENSNCNIIQSGTIAQVRSGLSVDDNFKGNLFVQVPVILNQYTILLAEIGDDVSQKVILVVPFSLHGVANASLPSANSATLANGEVQDLGIFGNAIRSALTFLFVPDKDFYYTELSNLQNLAQNKFPAYVQITTAIDSHSFLGGANVASPVLHGFMGSSDVNIIKFDALASVVTIIRSLITMYLWFYCLVYVIKSLRNFFGHKQLTMNI